MISLERAPSPNGGVAGWAACTVRVRCSVFWCAVKMHARSGLEQLDQPRRQRAAQRRPVRGLPPASGDAMALGQKQAASLGFDALPGAAQLIAQPRLRPGLFLGRRGHPHHVQDPAVARRVERQAHAQRPRVMRIGLHPRGSFVQLRGHTTRFLIPRPRVAGAGRNRTAPPRSNSTPFRPAPFAASPSPTAAPG